MDNKRISGQMILINIVVLFLIYFMDCLFPFAIDDIAYSGGISTNNPVYALALSIDRIRDFYFSWSGRILGNFLAFFMAIMNKTVYNICNALIHVLLCNLIYKYICPKRNSSIILLLIYLSMWLFTPEYGMLIIWTNASTIYQWTMVPLLAFGLVYYRTVSEEHNSANDGKSIITTAVLCGGMLILGLLAGNSFEPAAATMLLAGLFWLIWCIKNSRRIRCHELFGIVGFMAGFLIMLLSPGSAERARYVRENVVGYQNPIWELIFRIGRETYYTWRFMAIPFGISIALWVIACALNGEGTVDLRLKHMVRHRWREPVFIFLAFVSIYAMTFSIAYANRIMITPVALLIISMGISLMGIIEALSKKMGDSFDQILARVTVVILTTLTVFVLTEYATAMLEMKQTGQVFVKTTMFTEYNNNLFK